MSLILYNSSRPRVRRTRSRSYQIVYPDLLGRESLQMVVRIAELGVDHE